MTTRLTPEWTKSLVEVFGGVGAKGEEGESFLARVFSSWGWEYRMFPESKQQQIKGVDIEFRDPNWVKFYSADVKHNIDQYGNFFVETDQKGWLFNKNKTSDRIWHVNTDTGWMAWYGRDKMQQYVKSIGKQNTGLLKVTVKDCREFITRRRVTL